MYLCLCLSFILLKSQLTPCKGTTSGNDPSANSLYWLPHGEVEYWTLTYFASPYIFYLKSSCVMAWEQSFSKIRVTGRCSGCSGASNTLRQCVSRVETRPPSHNTWRFLSDLTIARMWCASENCTSMESWENGGKTTGSLWLPAGHLGGNEVVVKTYLRVLLGKHWWEKSDDDSHRTWMKNDLIAGEAGLRQE